MRSSGGNEIIDNNKERERRQERERVASRSRSRSPLSGKTNSEFNDRKNIERNRRHPSPALHDSENLHRARASPIEDVETPQQARPNFSPSPTNHSRRSKSPSPSRVEQVEAVARYAAEHAIRVAGSNSQNYSPPSSPPKPMSPLGFMDKSRKSSTMGTAVSEKSYSQRSNAPIIPPTTSKSAISSLPFFPNKENSSNFGLNALLSNGVGDTNVSRCPPIMGTNPLDSLSPAANPSGLTAALAAIQAGQSSIQQVNCIFLYHPNGFADYKMILKSYTNSFILILKQQLSLQLLLGAQGPQLQQTLAQNPLLAPILAASMTGGNPLNPLSGMSAPGGPTGQTGLPGLLSNLPGMGSSSSNDMAQQSQMLQAMSQLLMLNNPGNAPNPNLQSAALLQNQVSFK